MSRPHPNMFVGDVFETTNGKVTVVKYEGHHNVTVQFDDGTCVVARTGHITEGNLKNPNRPSLFGIGYIGVGEYSPTCDWRITPPYEAWRGMLRRVYDERALQKRPSYRGCSVVSDWHNFQTFAAWYAPLYEKYPGWELDKDLLVRGNKVYSPETCVMLPSELNKLLLKSKAKRGPNPIGVCYNKRGKKFGAYIQVGENVFLGYHSTAEDAFNAYKTAKEAFIKQQAAKWQSQIDPRAYNALMNYEVLITD